MAKALKDMKQERRRKKSRKPTSGFGACAVEKGEASLKIRGEQVREAPATLNRNSARQRRTKLS